MAEAKRSKSSSAGQKPAKAATPSEEHPRRLYRSKSDRMLAGVCGGLAEYFNIDAIIVRVVWVVGIFTGGLGVLAYLVAWVLMPENPEEAETPKEKAPPSGKVIWGLIFIGVGSLYLLRRWDWLDFYPFYFRWGPWWAWEVRYDLLVPILLIVAGILYILHTLRAGEKPGAGGSPQSTGGKTMDKKLTRSTDEKMIGGVCGGLAKYFNIDPTLVRIGWAILTLITNILPGVIAYIVMLLVVPEESEVSAPKSKAKTSAAKGQAEK